MAPREGGRNGYERGPQRSGKSAAFVAQAAIACSKDGCCKHCGSSDTEPSALMDLPANIKLTAPAHAKALWDLLALHQKTIGTVVHCEQGMSRSPAVAAAIAKKLGIDEARFWNEHQPNKYA